MASIFSRYKDVLIDLAATEHKKDLQFPLTKVGEVINGYTRGDFIIVGGKKTSGKGSFVLNNYVTYPLLKRATSKAENKKIDIKVIHINTRKSAKTTLEKLIVNYAVNKNGLCKLGVPSLYGLSGKQEKISRPLAKSIIASTTSVFEQFSEKGILSVITGRKSIYEISMLIKQSLAEYGEYNEELEEFVYKPEHADMIPIVSIDDITGITLEAVSGEDIGIRNSAAAQVALELKNLAKTYNILLVLVVPSGPVYGNSNNYSSVLEEVSPYHSFCDRVLLLKNPGESEKYKHVLGYDSTKFVSRVNGACYFRSLYVASNYMGASGVYLPLFMYPENGTFMELPPPVEDMDYDEDMLVYYDLVQSRTTIRDNFLNNK
jgi:hypothetical protein